MQVIYARISDDNHEWLKKNADNSGLSMTRILDDMLTEAREDSWSVIPARVQARFNRPVTAVTVPDRKKENKDARSGA